MKQIAFSFLALFASTGIFAQDLFHSGEKNKDITPFHDARDAMNGLNTTSLQQQAAWKSFIQQHPTWGARFSQYTQLPHRAFGTPISIAAGGNDPVAKAKAFLQQSFAGFNLPMNELILTRNYNDGKYINVDFKQVHNGVEILWSRINVRFTQDLKIMLFGLDVHRNIPSLAAGISPATAIQKAEQAIQTTITASNVSNDLKIFPFPENGHYNYRLAYQVNVETINDNKTPGNYLTYVDANNGEILYRQNQVKFFDVKVKGDVRPVNQYTATENRPLKNLKVVVGGTTYYTNGSGVATVPTGPANATIYLEGKWAKVIDKGTSATAASNNSHTFANSGDSTTYDVTVPHTNERCVNVYYHVDAVHDFMKSKLPSFTTMDNPLPSNVDVSGTCNAFYNGSSINFYAAGGGCNAFSYIGDVMSHEYGHGISDKFYNAQGSSFDNGAMGEGYSDTWANSILKTGIIGLGANSPTNFIRRYDNVQKIYPQDIEGEVHADGEIIAGAWWDVGVNWGSVDSMSSLFAKSYFGLATGPDGNEGQVFFDILIDALTYDDDNGNIYDGTPHFAYIVDAFAAHGILLLRNTQLNHNSPVSIAAAAPYTISVDAVSDFPAFLGEIKMMYRKKGTTPVTTVGMTKTGTNYTYQFPASTAGDVYEYMFALYDYTSNLTSYEPASSAFTLGFTRRNIPYYLLVGYNSYYIQNFDALSTSTPDWSIGNVASDNATSGKWVIDYPKSSQLSGDTVQTNRDHTSGSGKCAITGNSVNNGANANSYDVDGGRTTIITEKFQLAPFTQPVLSYYRWYTNSQDAANDPGKDYWKAFITYNDGATWTMAEKTIIPDLRWRRSVIIPDLTLGTEVRLMFIATDSTSLTFGGTLVDAALDDIEILALNSSATDIKDVSALQATIYPNPASNEVTIVTPEIGHADYTLLNAVGEVVLMNHNVEINNHSIKINTSNLSNGIYFVKLRVDGKSTTLRLTIQK